MDMSSMETSSSHSHSESSTATGHMMSAVFLNSQSTPLYSDMWTPANPGAYAATCVFLIVLASILRTLFAAKAVLEHRWLAQARNRRYVVVKGRNTEAGSIDANADAKDGSLVTANGIEERVRIVRTASKGAIPFRLSVDIPRAALVMVITGVAYLLMLAVMTMNIGYFFSVLGGTFIGEVAAGRFGSWEEH